VPEDNLEGEIRYFKSKLQRAKEKKGQFERLFLEDDELAKA